MSSIDKTSPAFQEAKKRAILFYDNEHDLNYQERMDLYVFYEELWRRTLLLASIGFATGVTLPVVLKKKNKLLNPLFPIVGGFLGLSTVPAFTAPLLYKTGMKKVHKKYSEGSNVDKVLQVTPDPFAKSWFWSNYFKQSASDPSKRIRDPRNPNAVIPEAQRPKNGIQGFGDDDRLAPQNSELTSAWDKIRTRQQGQMKSDSTNDTGQIFTDQPVDVNSSSPGGKKESFFDRSSYYGYAAPSDDPQSPSYGSQPTSSYSDDPSSGDSYLDIKSKGKEEAGKHDETSGDLQSYDIPLSGVASGPESAWDKIRGQNGGNKD